MKRQFQHPEKNTSGRQYWRSLDELAATPGFKDQLEREFPEGASTLAGVDRRQFFKLMAAGFALGGLGLAGCRRPEKHILPYGKSVEDIIPGLPLYYATAFPLRRGAIPLLAETHQGRPTKLEGNPTYKPYGGGTSLLAQATILDLYDPDRATTHVINRTAVTPAAVQDLLTKIGKDAAADQGAGLAFLAGESSSPTRARLVAALREKFPAATWAEYEAIQDEPPAAAAKGAFGRDDVKPVYRFAQAKRIVSIDADFFHSEAGSLYYTREFSKGRKVIKRDDPMNRLYAVESTFTLVGSMADHRLRLASSHMLAFIAALAVEITGDDTFARLAEGLDFRNKDQWLKACADDLRKHRGESIVIAGAHQPAQVHAIAFAINAALGNIGAGKPVELLTVQQPAADAKPATISQLAKAIDAGSVRTLVLLGGNPAYDAPAELDFAALLKKVPRIVRHGYYVDETSLAAFEAAPANSAHIGATHFLESWSDARTADGTLVPVQPMILPLFDGITENEILARIAGLGKTDPYTLVYETVIPLAGGKLPAKDAKETDSDAREAAQIFRKFLHDGLLEGSEYAKADVRFDASGLALLFTGAASLALRPPALSEDNLEVRFVTDHKVDDGRFANNGWLQECPDPITKIAWDNAILVSPYLGRKLGIEPGGSHPFPQVVRKEEAEFFIGKEKAHIAKVTLGGRTVTGPVHIQPGLSNFTIVLPLGYGRTVSGRVGKGTGHNFYPLRTAAAPHIATGAKIEITGEHYLLANTQEHWSMEGRDIVRETNYEEDGKTDLGWVNEMGMESHAPANLGPDKNTPLQETVTAIPRGNSLYKTPEFDGLHQWGMSIDLNTCIGCNACVVACQAENNIPVVGKDQVLRGREMHWIRLDRYYSDGRADGAAFGGEGNREIPEDPQVSLMPVSCQHCELAPCETVCPVNATVHDEEGLNTMAYNRCIGTRYCANNCPYKVRRFNFFDWNKRSTDSLYMGPLGEQKQMPELVKMVKNPDVTVRMRGVMEKCTYCVQRIQQARIAQKRKAGASGDVLIPDGTIKTACQQVCPVDGVTFGNLRDPESAVSRAKAREQDYALLGYLNIRPRTTYLGKLRNPNPDMPDYAALPFSRTEYDAKNHPHHESGGEGHGHEAAPAAESHDGHTSLPDTARKTIFGGLS
ncbi:Fe-S-cluster-containing hydrogenase subunit [Opitutaceae bacterium TAV1]|nr:Fe-S-cluster-containing hydrogenase subunit [Opitutaceae bacterium TAV1]